MDKVFFVKDMNKLHPCLCDICLEARDKELKRVRGKTKEEVKKMIEGMETNHKYCDAYIHDKSCQKEIGCDEVVRKLLNKLENL